MTIFALALVLFALSVGCIVLGAIKWKETGSEWWVIFLFFDMLFLLIAGSWLRQLVESIFGI